VQQLARWAWRRRGEASQAIGRRTIATMMESHASRFRFAEREAAFSSVDSGDKHCLRLAPKTDSMKVRRLACLAFLFVRDLCGGIAWAGIPSRQVNQKRRKPALNTP